MTGVFLPHELVTSWQWHSLSDDAVRLLVDMASCLDGRNNGRLRYTVRQAGALLSRDLGAAERTFRELERAGFIARTGAAHGGPGRGRGTARTWAISLWPGRRPYVPDEAQRTG